MEQEQDNTWTKTWPDFWADRRIGDLVRRSGDAELANLENQLRKKVYPLLFNDQAMRNVRPAIIHGDLWSGNSGTDESTGQPIIFDPSSSYCHNEAELGIMKMFGGYGSEFFDAYHSIIPKAEPFYEQRIDMYEAFHHLNHFVIFGGGYRSGTVRIFKKLIAWADEQNAKGGEGGSDDNDDGGNDEGKEAKDRRGLRGGARTDDNASENWQNVNVHHERNNGRSPPSPSSGAAEILGQQAIHSPASEGYHFDQANSRNSVTAIVPTPAQISDFFSQMICYIWFSSGLPTRSRPSTPARSPTSVHLPLQSSPLAPRRHVPNGHGLFNTGRNGQRSHAKVASTSALPPVNSQDASKTMQNHLISSSIASTSGINLKSIASDPIMPRLQPKGRFLRFTRELLGTTQLSTSVITLALIYVHKLKTKHPHLRGREGSEYRVAISALMLANKILDDNTYLNKTWAEISGMPLVEISKMEVEFWLGLKMEMHVSKYDYDAGLHELQLLANDRARLIREREALLKKVAFQQHQQQHQQKKLFATPYHMPSHPFHGQDPSPKVRQNGQGAIRQSVPDIQQHDWQSMAEVAAHRYPMSSPWYQNIHQPHAVRHSIGNGEIFQAQANWNPNLHARPISPENNLIHSGASHISPPQRQTPYTMPSSPLSQGSGVPSLATASNDALACFSEVEASTPQDVMPFYAMEQLMPMVDGYHGIPQNTQAQVPPIEQQQQQQQMAGEMDSEPMYNRSTINSSQPHFFQQASLPHGNHPSSRPSSAQTGYSSLKREFEKTKFGSTSPQDIRAGKRFAFDSNGTEGNRIRRNRFSSAGFQSPSERGQWARNQRPMSSSSPCSHPVEYSQRYHASVSPSSVIQPARLASPSSLAPFPGQSYGFATPPFLPMSEDASLNITMPGNNAVSDIPFAELTPMGSEKYGNYHSVFSSALTPNSLAAPLQFANGSWPMIDRSRAPLKYYSLAAGEARGNLGQYIPPQTYAINMAHNHHGRAFAPNVHPSHSGHYAGFNSNHGTPSNLMSNLEIPQSNPIRPAETHRAASSSYDAHVGTNKLGAPQQSLTMATTTPVSEFGIHQEQYPWGVGQLNAQMSAGTEKSFVDAHQNRVLNRPTDPPPFALDPQGWPLASSSTANSFLFPYHLVPTNHSQIQS